MSPLYSLPTELLEKILLTADLQTIARCQQVSTLFREVICKSTSITYRIELAINGCYDGNAGGWTIVQRLEALRNRRKAYITMNPTARRVVKGRHLPWRKMISGYFTWTDLEGRLHILQVPSVFRGIPEEEWVIDGSIVDTVHAIDLYIDPDENLLVILERKTRYDWQVSIRSFRTGEPHPEARLSELPINIKVSSWDIFGGGVMTYGDYVGAHTQGGLKQFVLLNWRTGQTILHIKSRHAFCYAFLSDRYLLIPHACADPDPNNVILSLIDLTKAPLNGGKESNLVELPTVTILQFELPFMCNETLLRLETTQCPPRHRRKQRVPFSPGGDDLIALTFRYNTEEQPLSTLLFPISRLLKWVGDDAPPGVLNTSICWNCWGSEGSRLLADTSLDFVNGMMALLGGSRWIEDLDAPLYLYDFGEVGARKHLAEVDQGVAPRDVQYDAQSIYQRANAPPIVTSLPARRMKVPNGIANRENGRILSVVVDDDCIVSTYSYGNDQSDILVNEYHIWSF
ncbi:hypothetical protein BXZ70DRAFT_63061 [Cristinia sonorae]|uniref:F-box domain-containing protein n=1 Tax=Cristinia sonorae TaxID=1940300 RepID=A0A8K0USK6_9AGAR|nr:hypothetical protein BXZ70DRAFT_63061 [Cristinia sonorae]